MRRFYVVPKSIIFEPVPDGPKDGVGEVIPHHHLFQSAGGWHALDLGNSGFILLCCDDFQNVEHEQLWHQHPEVARLHHPVHERNTPLSGLVHHPRHAHKQFKQKHLDALKHIGVTPQDTVGDVSVKASAFHPLVRLDKEY